MASRVEKWYHVFLREAHMKFVFRDESRNTYGKFVTILLNSSTTAFPKTARPPTQDITMRISRTA